MTQAKKSLAWGYLSKAKNWHMRLFFLPDLKIGCNVVFILSMKKYISLVLAAFLALSFSLAGCETTASKQGKEMAASGDTSFTVDVVSGLNMTQIKNSILLSLSARGWTVTEQGDGVIYAELDALEKREICGKLAIGFNETAVVIADHSYDSKGNRFVPIRWIKYLMRDINANMLLISSGVGA